LERKNDSHTISNKTFDFSKTTIRQLIQDGYKQAKEQMKGVEVRGNNRVELIKLFLWLYGPVESIILHIRGSSLICI
jgi:hypothetical protein